MCPIFRPYDKICNSNLWINPKTNEISERFKNGYVRGCGCHLIYKWRNANAHCIINKW